MRISFLDLKRQYESLKTEIDAAVGRVIESGHYIGGEEVAKAEEEIAEYSTVKYGVGVSSGTAALLASLMSMGIGKGDEVITTPFTFVATAEVIMFLQATPVFVDIEPETFNIDPTLLESKITERTRCIMPIHMFGHMSEMEAVKEIAAKYDLKVIEDAAQAIGASINGRKACSFGDAGCLSFYPTKNLGAFGEGGMVLTDNAEFAHRVRVTKEHGSEKRYYYSIMGFNGRLDAIQAAVLRIKLRHLDDWTRKRRENALYYNTMLRQYVTVPVQRDNYNHIFNQYSLLTDRRDELMEFLKQRGIATIVYYPVPLHLQDVFRHLGYKEGDFPVSERVCKRILSLPVYSELTEEEREYVTKSVIFFFEEGKT